MENINYKKFFRVSEILSAGQFFTFYEKIKIKVFVPESHIDRLLIEMSKAGAGRIGNYEKCSFRTMGTGTFIPLKKAKPFSGKLNELSYENEFKFEMECEKENVNDVVNALLKNHPYEEPAYEISNFMRRSKNMTGTIIDLKMKIKYSELMKRLNKNLISLSVDMDSDFKKIAVINPKADRDIIESAEYSGCDCLLEISKNNYKLYKL